MSWGFSGGQERSSLKFHPKTITGTKKGEKSWTGQDVHRKVRWVSYESKKKVAQAD